MADTDRQTTLVTPRIERVSQLGGETEVPVQNSSEAAWTQDISGRQWVIKWENNTGVEPLLAEAICWLLGESLGVPQPKVAVFSDGIRWAWMSERIPQVVHWDPERVDLLINHLDFGATLALDAISHNEDRHSGNILLQPAPDELRLRAYAIDSGTALVGWPDFHALGMGVPNPRNLARGLPVALLKEGALLAAAKATAMQSDYLMSLVVEACMIARNDSVVQLHGMLWQRLSNAPALVEAYLQKILLSQALGAT